MYVLNSSILCLFILTFFLSPISLADSALSGDFIAVVHGS
jgi:hypothetical protein